MKWVDLNGVALRYATSGTAGPAVVLVHEMGGSLESWDGVIRHLPDTVRTLRFDLRGSGLSEKIAGRARMGDLVADVAGLLDVEGIAEPVVVVGCAAGAAVAVAFAALRPERTAGIVGFAPAFGIQGAFRAGRLEELDRVETEGQRSIADGMLAKVYPEPLRAVDRDRFESYRARWISTDPHGFAALSRMLFDLTLDDYLPDVRCPALMVAGLHDPLRPPDFVRTLSRHIAGCEFVEVESGHFMHVQSPELVAAAIERFRRNDASARKEAP